MTGQGTPRPVGRWCSRSGSAVVFGGGSVRLPSDESSSRSCYLRRGAPRRCSVQPVVRLQMTAPAFVQRVAGPSRYSSPTPAPRPRQRPPSPEAAASFTDGASPRTIAGLSASNAYQWASSAPPPYEPYPTTPPPSFAPPSAYGSPTWAATSAGPLSAFGAPLASWWQRVGSMLLDGLVLGVPWLIFTAIVGSVSGNECDHSVRKLERDTLHSSGNGSCGVAARLHRHPGALLLLLQWPRDRPDGRESGTGHRGPRRRDRGGDRNRSGARSAGWFGSRSTVRSSSPEF